MSGNSKIWYLCWLISLVPAFVQQALYSLPCSLGCLLIFECMLIIALEKITCHPGWVVPSTTEASYLLLWDIWNTSRQGPPRTKAWGSRVHPGYMCPGYKSVPTYTHLGDQLSLFSSFSFSSAMLCTKEGFSTLPNIKGKSVGLVLLQL